VEVSFVVDNGTDDDLEVHRVRVAGDALGMTFFAFTAQLDVEVEAGATEARTFTLDVADLEGQANGLLDGRVELLDDRGEVVATEAFTADARGSLTSTTSAFGAVVAALTLVLLLGVVLGLHRDTLPANRFNRAVRFAEPGAGLGLVLTATLSSLRIVLVPAPVGLAVLAVGAAVGFGVGYTLASPGEPDVASDVASPATPPLRARSLAG
jgi:hypothetical protein